MRAAGYSTSLVSGHHSFAELPWYGTIVIAVPDHAMAAVTAKFAQLKPGRRLRFVHVSGALGLDALDALSSNPVGSFHPLQSFPSPRPPSAFSGITIAVDASTPALHRRLIGLARKLGAKPKHVDDSQRVTYHAAAVFASNFVNVVFAEAVRLLQGIGWTERESVSALLPLLDGAVANIHMSGPVQALTGPIRRGDADTVRRHLDALKELGSRPSPSVPRRGAAPMNGAETYRLYRMLGLVALQVAIEAGLDRAAAERTRRALTRNVAATRRRGQ